MGSCIYLFWFWKSGVDRTGLQCSLKQLHSFVVPVAILLFSLFISRFQLLLCSRLGKYLVNYVRLWLRLRLRIGLRVGLCRCCCLWLWLGFSEDKDKFFKFSDRGQNMKSFKWQATGSSRATGHATWHKGQQTWDSMKRQTKGGHRLKDPRQTDRQTDRGVTTRRARAVKACKTVFFPSDQLHLTFKLSGHNCNCWQHLYTYI